MAVEQVAGARVLDDVLHPADLAQDVTDEHNLSLLTRHLQPALRLAGGLERTTDRLVGYLADGQLFEGLYAG